ncbi:hypothetical protein CC78DRAFT_599266 [Lojkania enalia]|uniref:Uncharacterized protein n=1 Tax=Lojkania enalia TaxID=147567 RepID=A0A9P4JXV5_9PLEO|nr:hypothetical protein CC78DRAFT_599266 [Didymosphaeria enalia]
MSYPQLLCDNDLQKDYVTFSVPDHCVARKIRDDAEDDLNLRKRVAGKTLLNKLYELIELFENLNLEASPIEGRCEVQVKLCVRYATSDHPSSGPIPEVRYVIRSPKIEIPVSQRSLSSEEVSLSSDEAVDIDEDLILLYDREHPLSYRPKTILPTLYEEDENMCEGTPGLVLIDKL